MSKLNIIPALGISIVFSLHCHGEDFSSLVPLNRTSLNIEKHIDRIYIYFWATWCSECKKKIKNKLPSYKVKKNRVLFLLSTEKNSKRVNKYLAKYDVSFPVFVEPSRKIIGALGVKAVPAWGIWEKRDSSWKLIKFNIGHLEELL